MSSKRNKLLIILGLVTVAVSKSHNQRFDFEFESTRTSASKPSANSRHIDTKRADGLLTSVEPLSTINNYRGYISDLGDYSYQKTDKLRRRAFDDDYDVRTGQKKRTKLAQEQFRRRIGNVHQDSTDLSTEIDPEELYFEPQKVNSKTGKRKSGSNPAVSKTQFFSRRTGILIADTDKPNSESNNKKQTTETEAKDNTPKINVKNGKNSTKESQKPNNEKSAFEKDKPKRKKVLRVRIRGQHNNKTLKRDDKLNSKAIEKEKLKDLSNTQQAKHSNEAKIPEIKSSKIKDSNKDVGSRSKLHEVQQLKETFHSNEKTNIPQKKKNSQSNETKSNEPASEGELGSFFRRSGKKISKTGAQEEYPEPDWISKYKTENHNKDDNYYVLSFNYMGNRNDPIRDVVYLPKDFSSQKNFKNGQEDVQLKAPFKETGEYPSEELNIGNFEQVAGKFLERQRTLVNKNAADLSGYYQPNERDINPLNNNNGDNKYYNKKTDTSEDEYISDKNLSDKQNSPPVILKRKKTKQHNNPVWKLQAQKKKFSDDQWKQPKASFLEDQETFKTNGEEGNEKPNNGGKNYYVRSFIKLPTGDNVDINFKNDDVIRAHENIKEINVHRKPLLPLENKGTGNYFMHMYKKVGNIENFDIQRGENPDKNGYLSSLKLSWTDDDTRARVEEAVDSRAIVPKEHSYSVESTGSHEDIRRDGHVSQSSENIMHYKPHYVDDFMSPLNDDKSYFYPNVPIAHRHKRSADKVPRVATHFKLGESKVESNYTLDRNPKVRFFSKRLGSSVTNRRVAAVQPMATAQIQSRTGGERSIVPVEKQKNVRSYYHKPMEKKEMKRLKSEFNTSDIFDKYEKPSRAVTDLHIFHSYQSPNRDSKQAHDMTYFHNDKNRKMKIQITDKVSTRRMHTSEPSFNGSGARNVAVFNNFKTASRNGVVQSSTDIKASYAKPENKETGSKLFNQSNVVSKISQMNHTLQQRGTENSPVYQARIDKTTIKPTTAAAEKTTIKYITAPSDKTTIKYITKSDQTTTRPTTTTVRFFHKTGDLKAKVDDGTSSNIQSRRIDDKDWLYPKQENARDKNEELQQEVAHHLERNAYRSKRLNEPEIHPQRSRSFQQNSNGITPDKDSLYHQQENARDKNEDFQQEVEHHLERNTYGSKRQNEPEIHSQRSRSFQQNSNGITPDVKFEWQDPLNSGPASEQNYPMYHSIPKTHFTCRKMAPGYYADPETGCQVFHMCHGNGVKHSFLCPNTTIFNQRLLVCDWHTKVSCENAESFYDVNNQLYKYQSESEKNYKPQAEKNWNTQQNQNSIPTKYSHSTNENYNQNNQPKQANTFEDTEVTDMPQFIVNHFKENIPKAEFGKPKSVTKSYSAVIAKPESEIRSTNAQRDIHYSNENESPSFDQKLWNTDEKLIPDTFLEKQRAIKNSWNTKEMERTLNQELRSVPELSKDYREEHTRSSNPTQENSHNEHTSGKTKVIIPLINNGNSYYVPYLDDVNKYVKDEDAETHFAGRQNEKVIIVNRNRLHPDYESSEIENLPESGKTSLGESSTKFTHPVPTTITNQTPYNNAKSLFDGQVLNPQIRAQNNPLQQNKGTYERNQDSADNAVIKHNYNSYNNEARHQKPSHGKARIPQYIYPLPGIVQNNDGSREYNYGYRMEDPKIINLQKPEIFKLNAPRNNRNILIRPNGETSRFNENFHLKQDSETSRFNKNVLTKPEADALKSNKNILIKPVSYTKNDPQAMKIKWRIAEIKSGVESIGAEVGKILGGNENTFKNVRVFKLKPNSLNGELEEIRLTPFKFEKNSRIPQNSKLHEGKRESIPFETTKSNLKTHDSIDTEFKPSTQLKPINGGKRYESRLNSKANIAENTRANYGHTKSHIAVPKLVQQVISDIAPKYKEVSTLPPIKASYETGELRSHNQMIKVVPHGKRPTNPYFKREMNPVGSYDSINVNPHKQLPRSGDRIIHYNTEPRMPIKTSLKETSDKKYEIKYIPLIKVDEIKPRTQDKNLFQKQEIRKNVPVNTNGKSEKFDHVFVPKKIEGRGSSDFIYPDKIKIQENRDITYRTNPVDLSYLEHTDAEVKQNNKYKFDGIRNSKPRNNGDFNGNFQETRVSNIQQNNKGSLHETKPYRQKNEVRTFVVLTKPVPVTEKNSNVHSNKAKGSYQYNHKTILTPIQTKSQNLNQELNPSLECDDSSSSNQNSFNTLTLQLGKNGPTQEFIKHIPLKGSSGTERGNGDVRIYYNTRDESASKCRDQSNSKAKNPDTSSSESEEEKQVLNKKPTFYKKPVSKVSFKELKRPKYAYAPGKASGSFNTETVDETTHKTVQPKLKPIKLFELQRNSRPAFTKPLSQKPMMNPAIPESRNYYFPRESTKIATTLDESDEDSDQKSVERSKRVVNGKNARYVDIEKAAELNTRLQNNETDKKAEVSHFPAARNGPQGKIGKAGNESTEISGNHSRHSRYAALEKAAELKAEHMIRSKSPST